MKKTVILLILSFMMSFIFNYCNKDESTSPTPSRVCDQQCQDENLTNGFIDIFWFIWNQNIAGQPVGAKDFTVNGPQGGTVHVTGTTEVSASTGINTLHLVLEMNYCKGIDDKYNLIFNGIIGADGTFSTTHKAITYSSQQLNYTGTVGMDDWITELNGTCSITFNETIASVSGTICGRTFSY
jgi:hypothetical protein